MAKVCDITAKRVITGHNVSHSMRHTKRRFLPNLQEKSFSSAILGHDVRLRLTTNAIRTIDKYSGIDGFMLNWKPRKTQTFSDRALKIRRAILKRAAAMVTEDSAAK